MTSFTQWARNPLSGTIMFGSDGYPIQVTDPTQTNYLSFRTRIADEVLGPSSDSHVSNAVTDAIGTFERENFFFNELRIFTGMPGDPSSLTTQYGKEFISSDDFPPLITMPHIRNIFIFAFGNRYPLINRTPQWMDDQSMNPNWRGLPTDWCWESGAIRLYPIPNGAYPLILSGTMRFKTPVANTDVTPWFNEGEAVIRTEAKRLLYRNIARDAEQVAAMEGELYGNPQLGRQGYLSQLRRETQRRAGGPGKLRPSRGWF